MEAASGCCDGGPHDLRARAAPPAARPPRTAGAVAVAAPHQRTPARPPVPVTADNPGCGSIRADTGSPSVSIRSEHTGSAPVSAADSAVRAAPSATGHCRSRPANRTWTRLWPRRTPPRTGGHSRPRSGHRGRLGGDCGRPRQHRSARLRRWLPPCQQRRRTPAALPRACDRPAPSGRHPMKACGGRDYGEGYADLPIARRIGVPAQSVSLDRSVVN